MAAPPLRRVGRRHECTRPAVGVRPRRNGDRGRLRRAHPEVEERSSRSAPGARSSATNRSTESSPRLLACAERNAPQSRRGTRGGSTGARATTPPHSPAPMINPLIERFQIPLGPPPCRRRPRAAWNLSLRRVRDRGPAGCRCREKGGSRSVPSPTVTGTKPVICTVLGQGRRQKMRPRRSGDPHGREPRRPDLERARDRLQVRGAIHRRRRRHLRRAHQILTVRYGETSREVASVCHNIGGSSIQAASS
jgi:hypothetical protein